MNSILLGFFFKRSVCSIFLSLRWYPKEAGLLPNQEKEIGNQGK